MSLRQLFGFRFILRQAKSLAENYGNQNEEPRSGYNKI